MAWVAPVVAAGASVIGDAMSAMSAQSINQKTMNFDMDMVKQQEAFQQQQASTAVQTRMADIKAAGLNPLLAVTGGGAPAAQAMPGASMGAQLQNPGAAFGNLGSQMTGAVNSGIQAYQAQSNIGLQGQQGLNQAAQAANAYAQAAKTSGVDTAVSAAQVQKIMQDAATSKEQAQLYQSQVSNTDANTLLTQAKVRSEGIYQQLGAAQTQVAKAQVPQLAAQVSQLLSSRDLNEASVALSQISQTAGRLSNAQVQAAMGDVLSEIHSSAQLKSLAIPLQQAYANWASSGAGKSSPYIQQVQSVIGTLAQFMPLRGMGGTLPQPMSQQGMDTYLGRQ